MRVRVVDPVNIDSVVIAEAAAIIRAGGLVAFPTETVYGLGANATDTDAVEKIFSAKGRPSYNPLIVHLASAAAAEGVVTAWSDTAHRLATHFWPGPLTLVLPKATAIPDLVTAGLPTVGIRVPAHPVALALLQAADCPIAAPSANRSTAVSPTEAGHVVASLGGYPDLVLDAGPANVGIESTVLDLSSEVPTILRPGMISRAAIASVIGDVRAASRHSIEGEARPSPGMMDKHYSPRTRLLLANVAEIGQLLAREGRDRRVGVLVRSAFTAANVNLIPMPDSPPDFARALYATLRHLDEQGFDLLIVERVPAGDEWDGIRDRLLRAATSTESSS
jgi:L-threonylcarbamoyladenylate synthase